MSDVQQLIREVQTLILSICPSSEDDQTVVAGLMSDSELEIGG